MKPGRFGRHESRFSITSNTNPRTLQRWLARGGVAISRITHQRIPEKPHVNPRHLRNRGASHA